MALLSICQVYSDSKLLILSSRGHIAAAVYCSLFFILYNEFRDYVFKHAVLTRLVPCGHIFFLFPFCSTIAVNWVCFMLEMMFRLLEVSSQFGLNHHLATTPLYHLVKLENIGRFA